MITPEQEAQLETFLDETPGLNTLVNVIGPYELAGAIPNIFAKRKRTQLAAALGSAVTTSVGNWPTAIAIIRAGMPDTAITELASAIYTKLSDRDDTDLGKLQWLLLAAVLTARSRNNIPDPLPEEE